MSYKYVKLFFKKAVLVRWYSGHLRKHLYPAGSNWLPDRVQI